MGKWHRMARGLAVSWTLGSAILLLGIALGILTQPGFPLGLGLIRTTGLAGLWVTLVPALVALAGVVLLQCRNRSAAGLLVTYSAFWSVVVASALPVVWNAKSSFCLNSLGVCITSPWLGRFTTLSLLAPFLFVSVWFWRVLGARDGPGRKINAES
jgi:hypothetical protein